MCTDRQCKSNEFQCKSTGKCILDLFVCDHQKECEDGSDEEYDMCEATYPICSKFEFTCRNYRCVPRTFICDHIDHCKDGSDEEECSTTVVIHPNETSEANPTLTTPQSSNKCNRNQFHCAMNGECINAMFRCDGHEDCADGSDEEKCTFKDCSSDEFLCAYGSCLQRRWVCDGENDCFDGSDERNCTTDDDTIIDVDHSVNSEQSSCPRHWYKCDNGQCIPYQFYCDGNADCQGGDDEASCINIVSANQNNQTNRPQLNSACGEDKFMCYKTNQCILAIYMCDGDMDCEMGEDELNCKSSARQKCPDNQFTCFFSNMCVPLKQVCNGHTDCLDGSDEMNCENARYRQNSMCLGEFVL